MTQVTKPIDGLDLGRYELASPCKTARLLDLHRSLLPLSLVVSDAGGRVVFGHAWLRQDGASMVGKDAQCLALTEAEAWLLAYRMLDSFQLAGLYEQLALWCQLAKLLSPEELRRQVSFPFSLQEDIAGSLPNLFACAPLRELLEQDALVWQSLFRILVRDRGEWPAWGRFFSLARFSRSRQIALMDALEEIVFRDKGPLGELVERLAGETSPGPDRAEAIWSQVYAWRYPQTCELEDVWHRQLKDLHLPVEIKLRHAPFFESDRLELSAQFVNFQHFLDFWKPFISAG
jgi:hypothetical protein